MWIFNGIANFIFCQFFLLDIAEVTFYIFSFLWREISHRYQPQAFSWERLEVDIPVVVILGVGGGGMLKVKVGVDRKSTRLNSSH